MELHKEMFDGYCGSTNEIRLFFEELGVAPITQGIVKEGEILMELWRTASGDFWAMLMTKPDDLSCVCAYGADLMVVSWFLPGQGA